MTFSPRALPKVIIFADAVITGPFCSWCGNPGTLHRAKDSACPKRRMHPLLPRGEREIGCITPAWQGDCVSLACPVYKFHYDQQRDGKLAPHLFSKRG